MRAPLGFGAPVEVRQFHHSKFTQPSKRDKVEKPD